VREDGKAQRLQVPSFAAAKTLKNEKPVDQGFG